MEHFSIFQELSDEHGLLFDGEEGIVRQRFVDDLLQPLKIDLHFFLHALGFNVLQLLSQLCDLFFELGILTDFLKFALADVLVCFQEVPQLLLDLLFTNVFLLNHLLDFIHDILKLLRLELRLLLRDWSQLHPYLGIVSDFLLLLLRLLLLHLARIV